MESILLPSGIKVKEGKHKNHSIIEISPCYFGYGTTLGNALRRVLLSSLPGAAVTAVKIKGAQHEFSSLENVAEDTLEILLNFKRLRLRIFTDEPVRLKLKAKGKKDVTGADIAADSNVEIVNPDLKLATLTSKDAEIEIDIFADKGRGYVSTEQREEKEAEIGVMGIDSIYSPVLNVGYKVENVRVGQITDYDKLIMNIETDGTLSPEEALSESAKILINYFSLLTKEEESDKKETTKKSKKAKQEEDPEEEDLSSDETSDEEEKPKKARKKSKKSEDEEETDK
jgi:DNA-directed RNA polymerase subunit alpha